MFKVKGGFSCDRQSKYDFTASTVNYIREKYKGKDIELIFTEFDKYGNIIDFDSNQSYEKSPSDLLMFFNGIAYRIELKERWKYDSNYYGNENNGWILEPKKYHTLKTLEGIPLYVNLYNDGKIRIWNLDKIDSFQTFKVDAAEKTVEDSEVITKKEYAVFNKDSKILDRIKGTKSNGIWKSKGLN